MGNQGTERWAEACAHGPTAGGGRGRRALGAGAHCRCLRSLVLPPPSHLGLETPPRPASAPPPPQAAPPCPLVPTYLPRIPSPRGRPLGPHPTRCPRPPGRGCPAAAPPLQTAWGWGTGRTPRGPGSAGGQGHLQSGGPLFSLRLLLALAFLLPGPKWHSQLGLQPAPWPQSDLHDVVRANPGCPHERPPQADNLCRPRLPSVPRGSSGTQPRRFARGTKELMRTQVLSNAVPGTSEPRSNNGDFDGLSAPHLAGKVLRGVCREAGPRGL